jgi:hypothetical protein
VNLNLLAIALGFLAAFIFNAIWFGPKTFYPAWFKALGKPMPKREEVNMSAKGQIALFGGTFAGQLAAVLVLAVVIGLVPGADWSIGALTGLGLGVVAAGSSLGHRLFSYQGFKVWIIEVAADVIGLMLAGAIIGAF